MKFIIKHEIKGRLRVHMVQKNMSANQADTLLYYLNQLPCILDVKVYERTADASITYKGDRQKVLDALLVDRVKKWIYTIIMQKKTNF